MKCLILFSRKKNKKNVNLLSAESAHSMEIVNAPPHPFYDLKFADFSIIC